MFKFLSNRYLVAKPELQEPAHLRAVPSSTITTTADEFYSTTTASLRPSRACKEDEAAAADSDSEPRMRAEAEPQRGAAALRGLARVQWITVAKDLVGIAVGMITVLQFIWPGLVWAWTHLLKLFYH